MSFESSSPASLSERLSRATFGERVALIWPIVILAIGLAAASIFYINRSIDAQNAREQAIQELAANIPDPASISALKNEVDNLKAAIPSPILLSSQKCVAVPSRNEKGEIITTNQCTEVPARATVSLKNINDQLGALSEKSANALNTIRRLQVSERDAFGAAYANDDSFPTNRDKSVVMYAILTLLFFFTGCSFYALLFSSNSRVVTYAIDTLKVLGGFFTGLLGSIFGLGK
jgi:hypothetical protein